MTTAPLPQQPCPHCGQLVPVNAGFRPWCDRCDWNVDLPDYPLDQSLFGKLYRSLNQRSSQHLLTQMLSALPVPRTLTPSLTAALLLAAFINGLTLALAAFGLWLAFFAFPDLRGLGALLGLACFALAALFLPRLPGPPGIAVARTQFPRMYELVDRVASTVGSPRVDVLRYDLDFNAGFGQFGWRRQRHLILGLPLLSLLEPQELVALIAHELAHGVHGDPARGLFLGTAMHSLAVWYELLDPRRRLHLSAGIAQPFLILINLVAIPLTALVWLVGYALSHLIWYDSQRAEYHADWLAAQLGGTPAQLSTLNKAQLYELFRTRLKFAYLDRKGHPDFFADLKQQSGRVPEREFERLRRADWLLCQRYGTTHPPTVHRRQFLAAHPTTSPRLILSPTDQAALEQELIPLLLDVQRQIFALDDHHFRQLFHMSW